MYLEHFGLKEEPFSVSPDSRFLYASPRHSEAAASLYTAIAQRRGFAVLIGAPGLGKTSLLVNLAARLAPIARVAFLLHEHFDRGTSLSSILLAMGLEPEQDPIRRDRQFYDFLVALDREGKTCVVIVDEAQQLDIRSLESLRLLSNFELPGRKLVQFVLSGQSGFARLLRSPECEQILQRVNIIARLQPLDPQEVGAYIAHRLETAGGKGGLFTPAAVRAIAAGSRGVPRNINTLCFNALTLAFAQNKKTVDDSCVREAVDDRLLDDDPLPAPRRPKENYAVKITIPSMPPRGLFRLFTRRRPVEAPEHF